MEEKIEFAQIQDWTPFVVWFGNYEQPVVKGNRSPNHYFFYGLFCNQGLQRLLQVFVSARVAVSADYQRGSGQWGPHLEWEVVTFLQDGDYPRI